MGDKFGQIFGIILITLLIVALLFILHSLLTDFQMGGNESVAQRSLSLLVPLRL
jgi:hypothetical protein